MTTNDHHDNSIVINKKAHFDYFIENTFEAGLALEGWEVKSLRAIKVNITDAHIILKNMEAWLLGAQISPLPTTSTHTQPDPKRTRRLLLNRRELNQLIGSVERQGYTIIPLAIYWKKNRIKIKIALAKGKKTHDKRDSIKDRDWKRDQTRIMKKANQ